MARDPPKTRAVEPAQAVEVDFTESNAENEFIDISVSRWSDFELSRVLMCQKASSNERTPKASAIPNADADEHVKSNKTASDRDACNIKVRSR